MANYESLKAAIQDVVKTNGNNEITGALLQQSLLAMVNSFGLYYQFCGGAFPATNPGTPDQNVAYIAGPGTYPNFDNATVPNGALGIFLYDGEWVKSIFRINEDYTSLFALYQPNLINPSLVVTGYLGVQGQDFASTRYYRTDNYISVTPNTSYKLLEPTATSRTFRRVSFYDRNKEFISNTDSVSTFTTPNNAVFVRVAWLQSYGTTIGLFLSTINAYVPFIQTVLLNATGTIDDFPNNAIIRKIDLAGIYSQLQTHQNEIGGIKDKTDYLTIIHSPNLINPDFIVTGYLGISGEDYYLDGYLRTDNYIPVTPDTSYKLLEPTATSHIFRRIAFYDANKEFISLVDSSATFTTPSNAAFVRVAWRASYGSDLGLFESSVSNYARYYNMLALLGDETFIDLPDDAILRKKDLSGLEERVTNLENEITGNSVLSVEKNDVDFRVNSGNDFLLFTFDKNPNDYYGGNPVVNFIGWSYNNDNNNSKDNVAPMHILGTTLGANHAMPIRSATIANHGKTNADVGGSWTQDGHTFYLVRVVDTNVLWFISENTGSVAKPVRYTLTAGQINNGGIDYTITATTSVQFYPGVNNVVKRVFANGKNEIINNGVYQCNYLDIIEEYDLMNVDSTVAKLIARLGNTQPPVYDGEPLVHIRNVYRIMANNDNLTCIIFESILPSVQIEFENFMFAQEAFKDDATQLNWYLPNSIPGSENFVVPGPWDVVNSVNVNSDYWADQNNPVNRVLAMNNNVCFAIGFLKTCGVGKSLKDLTLQTFELRGGGSGKIYSHGVEYGKVGTLLGPSDIYTGVLYKCFSKKITGNRIAYYHFNIDGKEYVFVDYRSSCVDKIVIDNEFNGKNVIEIESRNVLLKSDVYNNGVDVVANYISGQTCYIVFTVG